LLRTDDIDCAFTGAGDFDGIDQTAALCLFRISQEALNNVLKHAAARHVVVRLVRTDGVAELTIDDDGRGFDASRVRARVPGSAWRACPSAPAWQGGPSRSAPNPVGEPGSSCGFPSTRRRFEPQRPWRS
jgi:signal transduction histidine kinase